MNGTRALHPSELNPSVIARFESKYQVDDSGCWLWTAAVKSNGYGVFGIGPASANHSYYAHRVAYVLYVGEIPDGLHIDHLCRVKACVNPEHLEPVTNAENHARQVATVTHCPRNHEYTDQNTLVSKGTRYCRECNRESAQRRRDANVLRAKTGK